jgi:hypothetical protein
MNHKIYIIGHIRDTMTNKKRTIITLDKEDKRLLREAEKASRKFDKIYEDIMRALHS